MSFSLIEASVSAPGPTPSRQFLCLIPLCGHRMSERDIGKHVRSHYRTPFTDSTTTILCAVPGCQDPGPYKLSYIGRHVKCHYPAESLGVVCESCGVRISRGDSLTRHYLAVHKIALTDA
ncbi:hypothetical protein HWV62_34605 [Athelia sp. TMB]|nr:hypothetical protein HWV62_34605 [Athelia sp. TMB]